MKRSFLILFLFLSLANGEETSSPREIARQLFTDTPRTLAGVQKAADKLSELAQANPDNYEDQWQAARAWAWLAEFAPKRTQRDLPAKQAIAFARRACHLENNKVEGHYFLAIALGALADSNHGIFALDYIEEMETEHLRCIELDERFDEAGSHRSLGLLKLELPASFNEKIKRATPHLRRALELSPNYPENQLAWAQLRYKQGEDRDAFDALAKVLSAKPWPSKPEEDSQWKAAARELKKKITP